jgi:uncharacterized protein YcfJ
VRNLIASAALLCSALAVTSAPLVAQAADHQGQHHVRVCRDVSSQGSRNTGTVVGALAGGLAGNALSHGGGKTGGTILGAGIGAVAGHQIAKHNATHQVCHWEWRNNH